MASFIHKIVGDILLSSFSQLLKVQGRVFHVSLLFFGAKILIKYCRGAIYWRFRLNVSCLTLRMKQIIDRSKAVLQLRFLTVFPVSFVSNMVEV